MDVIEGYEAPLNENPKLWSSIQAVAFSYDWDAHKIRQQVARAWREGRVVDSISAIMEECENSSTSLVGDSDNSTSDYRPSANTGAQDGETSLSTTGTLDGASLNSAPLLGMTASVPAVDVIDKVPIDCVSDNVPVAEARCNAPVIGVSDNVPIVVSDNAPSFEFVDNVPNVEVSDSARNDRIDSSAPSACANSTELSLHEQVRALQNENRLLVKQIMCLHCSTAERDSLFMPCGHFIMCSSCSDKVSVCPLCNVTILATSRTRL